MNSRGAKEASSKTHIEVCARIRPLQITMQSSSSYFGGKDTMTSPSRKPQIPKRGIQPPKSTTKKQEEPPKSPSEDGLFYAWDVVGNDTATQSPRTDIVPGRTHQYTLDKVYGPSATTKDLYNKSVRPLVNSAMEGT